MRSMADLLREGIAEQADVESSGAEDCIAVVGPINLEELARFIVANTIADVMNGDS